LYAGEPVHISFWLQLRTSIQWVQALQSLVETCLEVNAEKNKYMVMYRDYRAGQKVIINPLKGGNSSNIWKEPQQIKTAHSLRNQSRLITQCLLPFDAESFHLLVCYPKIQRLKLTEI
jgi:hypothetical protein